MSLLRSILRSYQKVERHILYLILAEFFIQLINSSFFLLFNYHMAANGYLDYEIADIISYRFLMVLVLALPLGFLMKRVKLKPFFLFSAIMIPIISLTVIYAVYHKMDSLIQICMMAWGLSFAFIQVSALPFILMYAKKETHSEAISMFFQTWSIAIFLSGMLNYILSYIAPDIFDEGMVLTIFSLLGVIAIFMVLKIKVKEIPKSQEKLHFSSLWQDYDWKLILQAVVPTLIIAIGAGFTIPVINLFFLNVHGIESSSFSMYGALTYLMVAVGMTFMPYFKRKFGYQMAITLFQSLAVLALFFMAMTEYFKGYEYAWLIAVFFYIIRQPLMNVAGPMTSELTMYYVGEKNQEMISALNSAIWSGSWLFSMAMFSYMRKLGWQYVTIFMITVGLYVVGVVWYAFLIKAYNRRDKEQVV